MQFLEFLKSDLFVNTFFYGTGLIEMFCAIM